MKIYVGHDSREDIAYQVCEHSIKRRDPSAEVIPLKQRQMREQGLYTRPVDKLASTEFTFTRNQKKELRWTARYRQYTQEKIGRAWSYGTANILRIKY